MRAAQILVLLLTCSLATSLLAQQPPATAPSTQASSPTVIVGLDGEINEFTRASVLSRIEQARKLGAKTIILRLNTPGGMVGPAMDISRALKRLDDVTVIAYVEEMAYSAGAMIAIACDQIYMQPGSFIGDCAPIVPGQQLEGAERAKIESVLLAEFYDSAQRNGYDPLLAQSMVQYGRVVHYIQNEAGARKFVSDTDYEKLSKEGWKPVDGVPNPVDGPNELLTVNADVAQKLGLSRGAYTTSKELAAAQGLNVLATLEPTGGELIIAFLSSMEIRALLSVAFTLALLTIFRSPGLGYPEVIAVASLSLMVGVPMLTGYAEWYEILAIVIGVILLAVELFIIPGFGVIGISGICLILLGLVLTFAPSEPPELPGILPSLPGTMAALRQGTLVVIGGMLCSLLLWIWLQRYLPTMPYLGKLILTTGGPGMVESGPAVVPMVTVGARGRAATDLRPGGSASFHDPVINDSRLIDVISDSGFVLAGTEVVVRELEGNRVVVRAVA